MILYATRWYAGNIVQGYVVLIHTQLTNPASAVDSIAKSLIEDVESKTGDDGYMDWLARSVTGTMYVGTSMTASLWTVQFRALTRFHLSWVGYGMCLPRRYEFLRS